MNNIYKNIEEYNRNKKRKILIVFDDTIADMLNNKKLSTIVTVYFLEVKNLPSLLFSSHNLISLFQKILG